MKIIQLNKGLETMVDDEDYDFLFEWKWAADRKWWALKHGTTFYAQGCENGKKIYMHRKILGLTDPKIEVDHKDRNGLNNQRSNLRIVTHIQNMANTGSRKNASSQYLGVCWEKDSNKWVASIGKERKYKKLGRFVNEIEAAKAYNEAAKVIHGEFANLNKV